MNIRTIVGPVPRMMEQKDAIVRNSSIINLRKLVIKVVSALSISFAKRFNIWPTEELVASKNQIGAAIMRASIWLCRCREACKQPRLRISVPNKIKIVCPKPQKPYTPSRDKLCCDFDRLAVVIASYNERNSEFDLLWLLLHVLSHNWEKSIKRWPKKKKTNIASDEIKPTRRRYFR